MRKIDDGKPIVGLTSRRLRETATLAGIAGLVLFPPGAFAQQSVALATSPPAGSIRTMPSSDPGFKIEEVIVTATKRATTVQKTPESITAITSQELQDRGIASLAALAQGTPGVSLKSEGPSQTEIEMRGMTSSGGNSATVGFYLDDVPLSGPASAQNGHVVIDPDLYDLNRIEMLRGPQGTLFGSGSMGGTVRLITNQPDPSGYAATAEGMYSATDGGDGFNNKENAMVNIPLADTLALRIVGTESYTSGWIDRIVIAPGFFPQATPIGNVEGVDGTTRGDVQNAPIANQYPGSNANLVYALRTSLLWQPTANLTITPSFFYEISRQNGISAYDSVSNGTAIPSFGEAHYQPFNIAEPLKDKIAVYSLNMNYNLADFEITSSTGYFSRVSSQIEEASEAFNNPSTAITCAIDCTNPPAGPYPGFYGATGTGPESGLEVDPTKQLSEELRLTSKGDGPLNWVTGLYFSDYSSAWTFNGTTPNFSAFGDLGTLAPATTPHWFDADSPTSMMQYAIFGDASYAVTDALKIDAGVRLNRFIYRFSSCISGWGSALGSATPSCRGLIPLDSNSFTPKLNASYTLSSNLMVYANAAEGFRPGGGNALYPTTGPSWSAAFAAMHYTSGTWPATYKPDSVWSYEIGEKARPFHWLTLNSSVYFEDWRNIQLEAFPADWALNINGNNARIFGADVDATADLGGGFDLEVSAGYLNEYLDGGPHWIIHPVHTLPEVAPESGSVALSYARQLTNIYTLTARVDNSYTGVHYSIAFPYQNETTTDSGQYLPLPAYDLTNVRVGIMSSDSWTATLFVDNVFNQHAQLESMFTENLPTTPFNRIETNQPLTGGIELTYQY
ncbi:MAG: TonB-dependent receptor [Rhizomicrobium sp.]|jgi:outer membrane receptor protein involved in Fe transport